MSIELGTLLRVLETCDALHEEKPLISLVVPKKGGGSGQVFLPWVPGKSLRNYIRDPVLNGVLSVYQATYSRIIDHNNVKRRLSYEPREGDEIRFIPTKHA